jgi:hypothetical protein
MRSRAEWALRALVLGMLGWYLARVLMVPAGSGVETGSSALLPDLLARWSTVTAPTEVHVALAYPPPIEQRDWLAALPGAGTAVRWTGAGFVPTAVALEPIADPAGGADIAIAAPDSALVILRDALGPLDSMRAGIKGTGVRVYVPRPPGAIEVAVGAVVARAVPRDSLRLGRLLLLGGAGWEAKFTAAALEERGWKIDAHLAVSPKGRGDVTQGRVVRIDTATYAAVLALDTIAARYADQIARYVRSGGGLVLWPSAAQARGLTGMAPGAPGEVLPDDDKAPSDSMPRMALAMAPIRTLRPDALVLERRGDLPALAARRIGPGRVVQTAYLDSWRWRMAGKAESAPAAHREWLARLVAGVAYTGRYPLQAPAADVAPLATLVGRLGPAAAAAGRGSSAIPPAWIFGLIIVGLVLEWASRRLRGVK